MLIEVVKLRRERNVKKKGGRRGKKEGKGDKRKERGKEREGRKRTRRYVVDIYIDIFKQGFTFDDKEMHAMSVSCVLNLVKGLTFIAQTFRTLSDEHRHSQASKHVLNSTPKSTATDSDSE